MVGVLAKQSHPVVASIVALIGVIVVGMQGYLIPGTPQLTRQLPEPLLSRIGKTESASKLSASKMLISHGILNDDLSLNTETAQYVCERAQLLDANLEALKAATVNAFPNAAEISVRRSLGGGENWFISDTDEMNVQQWEARSVAAIDTASAEYLSEKLSDWTNQSDRERRTMLILLRYTVPNCPSCGEAFREPDGPNVTCCGGRSLVGERRCDNCEYALVDRNDLPSEAKVNRA